MSGLFGCLRHYAVGSKGTQRTCLQPRLRMITDDSAVDVSIKSERLETLTNPKLEQEPEGFQG